MTDQTTSDSERRTVIEGSDRRSFLQVVGGTAVTAAGIPELAAAADDSSPSDSPRVPLPHGVAAGDVTHGTAVIWTRAAREARILVAYSPHESFDDADVATTTADVATTTADAAADFTGQVRLRGLESATRYHYRVVAVESGARLPADVEPPGGGGSRHHDDGAWQSDAGFGASSHSRGRDGRENRPGADLSTDLDGLFDDAAGGTFVTAPAPEESDSVSFAWSGDTWGYGDDPIEPPYPGLASIAEQQPDFFVYLGDTIYADAATPAGKITENTRLDDALPIYREKYREMRVPPADVADRSNLLGLLESTSVYSMWDDHEVINNFAGPIEPLMPFGRRAFVEYWPLDREERRGWNRRRGEASDEVRLYGTFQWGEHLELFVLDTRQYRDPNVELDEKSLLGAEQREWLKSSLSASDATWKVLISPPPVGHPSDSWATPADQTGYEAELLDLVRHVETEPISNVVSIAGDVHHSQVAGYDPDDDGEFELYEAIAGPLGAPAGEPGDLYGPLNPTEFFGKGSYANYGTVEVDESGETLTLAIYDEEGAEQFSKTVEASEAAPTPIPDRIESTFDDGTEGWLVSQNGGSNTPEWEATGGNPGGHVRDDEDQGGVAWYYQAPFRFLGDRADFYGGTLSFDLRQRRTDQQFDAEPTEGGDVVLRSGGTTLVYAFRGPNANPTTEWRTFEVPLTASAGWITFDSAQPLATESELREVLADLDTLRIRGEYRSGADRSFLDNVVLTRE